MIFHKLVVFMKISIHLINEIIIAKSKKLSSILDQAPLLSTQKTHIFLYPHRRCIHLCGFLQDKNLAIFLQLPAGLLKITILSSLHMKYSIYQQPPGLLFEYFQGPQVQILVVLAQWTLVKFYPCVLQEFHSKCRTIFNTDTNHFFVNFKSF